MPEKNTPTAMPSIEPLQAGAAALPVGIGLWRVDTSVIQGAGAGPTLRDFETIDWLSVLSADERQRAIRYRLPRHGWRFALTRAALRQLLGRSLGLPAKEIVFTHGSTGQPLARYPEGSSNSGAMVNFSVSHADTLTLFALSNSQPLGIDIETPNSRLDCLSAADGIFSPQEIKALKQTSGEQRQTLFFELWTAREALLKLWGTGFSIDPRHLHLLDTEWIKRSGVRVHRLELADHIAALAVNLRPAPR